MTNMKRRFTKIDKKHPQLTKVIRISPDVYNVLKVAADSWNKPVSRYVDEQIRRIIWPKNNGRFVWVEGAK